MSGYDPQRRRRLTTRANTTAVEALLDGEPARPRARATDPPPAPTGAAEISAGPGSPATPPHAARSGCLMGLLGLRHR